MIYVARHQHAKRYHTDEDCHRIADNETMDYPDDHPITEHKEICAWCDGHEPDEETRRSYGNGLARKIRMQHEDGEKA